jgi:hypothetical protein
MLVKPAAAVVFQAGRVPLWLLQLPPGSTAHESCLALLLVCARLHLGGCNKYC